MLKNLKDLTCGGGGTAFKKNWYVQNIFEIFY
jgi:hypothetical protein